MASNDKDLCEQLVEICRINHELLDVLGPVVEATCQPPAEIEQADGSAWISDEKLHEAIRVQQSIFHSLARCLEILKVGG